MSENMRLLLLLAGAGLIVYGAWLAWPPAAAMLAGAAVIRVATYRMAGAERGRDAAAGR